MALASCQELEKSPTSLLAFTSSHFFSSSLYRTSLQDSPLKIFHPLKITKADVHSTKLIFVSNEKTLWTLNFSLSFTFYVMSK